MDIKPTFEDRDAFTVVGCGADVAPNDPAIGNLWGQFAPRIGEVTGRIGLETYGLCCPMGEGVSSPDRFIYIAGVQAEAGASVPSGMQALHIEAKRYAVFPHESGLGPQLAQTFQYIFGEWLPASGYKPDGIDFELYGDAFNPMTGEGTFHIYVPILPA